MKSLIPGGPSAGDFFFRESRTAANCALDRFADVMANLGPLFGYGAAR
jgi:hypothetical protein